MKKPIPTDKERSFEPHEMFFSSTDKRGIITSGNSVFQKISGYTTDQLMGAPHNIIRHPDMPKIVFKALWDTIQAGKPICAYVKNMAANGDYYWVLATVFPMEGGFLSVRIKPASALFDAARAVYPLVLEEEKKHGVDASAVLLFKLLADAGFPTYESFMTRAIVSEIAERQRVSESVKISLLGDSSDIKRVVYARNREFSRMFGKLSAFSEMNKTLSSSILQIMDSFSSVRPLSINMSLASCHLGKTANTLAVVSESFQSFAEETNKEVTKFNEIQGHSRSALEVCEFRISCAFLQNQMMMSFINDQIPSEASTNSEKLNSSLQMLANLTTSLVKEASSTLGDVEELLSILCTSAGITEKAITTLELVRQTGKVEAAQIPGATESIDPYLQELQKITKTIRGTLRVITEGMELLLDDVGNMREETENLLTQNGRHPQNLTV